MPYAAEHQRTEKHMPATVTMTTNSNYGILVDELGRLKAQIADLEAREKELKAALEAFGPGAYEGALFRATISDSVRATLDMVAVRAKLSAQFIRAHTTERAVRTVRVVARNGAGIGA